MLWRGRNVRDHSGRNELPGKIWSNLPISHLTLDVRRQAYSSL